MNLKGLKCNSRLNATIFWIFFLFPVLSFVREMQKYKTWKQAAAR